MPIPTVPTTVSGALRTLWLLIYGRSAEVKFEAEARLHAVSAAGRPQVVGGNPTIWTALLNIAPTTTAASDLNPLAPAERIDDAIASARP
jgi:hypothetical protein